jgi:acyl-CoA-binding protein
MLYNACHCRPGLLEMRARAKWYVHFNICILYTCNHIYICKAWLAVQPGQTSLKLAADYAVGQRSNHPFTNYNRCWRRDTWKKLQGMTTAEAQDAYIKGVKALFPEWQPFQTLENTHSSSSDSVVNAQQQQDRGSSSFADADGDDYWADDTDTGKGGSGFAPAVSTMAANCV